MKDIIDYLKARPILAIAAGIGILLVFILAIILGAKLWQAIAALFGFGAGGAQIARTYAKKDAERIKTQADIDTLRQRQLSQLDQTRMKAEHQIKTEQTKTHNEIDKAVKEESADEMRARIIRVTRGPLQCILWGSLVFLAGCATTVGAPGGTQIREVCFTKQEAGDILKRIADLQTLIKQCQVGATHDKTKANIECQAMVARWQLEARICSEKLTACSAKTCPTCWLPWLIVGVSLAATVTVTVYAGVKLSGVVP